MKKALGIKAKKDKNFSEWYSQLVSKSDLIEYTDISGCYVLKPVAYSIWKKIQNFLNKKIESIGVKNTYFPLLIPESLLKKEVEHIKGFTPEVAWVTQTGSSKLKEKLAIRPTSETIMYPLYSKWIRSYRDLPLKLNQWNNIIRWEFKHSIPFMRSREFLWQEGHTAFANKKEAEKEVKKILTFYKQTYEDLLAVPVIEGKKTEKEKFAGASYTLSIETFLPNGKAAQCATSHHLGQKFAKAFNIRFSDKDKNIKYVYQNSWGLSTRSIGIMIMMHSDNNGLVLPPKVCDITVVIIPIYNKKTKSEVIKIAKKIKSLIKNSIIDDRKYTPGFKFNEWELKGIPLRIEIGPREIKKKECIIVRRDTRKKQKIKISQLKKQIPNLLKEIQDSLFKKAQKFLKDSIIEVKTWKEFGQAIKNKKLIKTFWCGSRKCEDIIKDETSAKTLVIPFNQPKNLGCCIKCNKKAKYQIYFAKSY